MLEEEKERRRDQWIWLRDKLAECISQRFHGSITVKFDKGKIAVVKTEKFEEPPV